MRFDLHLDRSVRVTTDLLAVMTGTARSPSKRHSRR